MKIFINSIASLFLIMVFCVTAIAEGAAPKQSILITNANIFDGMHEKLATGMSVLVKGNKISKIAKSIKALDGATVIDAKGKVLMPGLTDAHWHVMFANPSLPVRLNTDLLYLSILGAKVQVRP